MEKISIIIPVYNSEKYLDKCLTSLINQTHKNIEIIAVNDGSTDNSEKILKQYQKQCPDIIKIYTWENHGIGATRNKGLELATGDYIGFVDSDDYVEVNMYSELLKRIKETNSEAAICNIQKFNNKGKCGEIITSSDLEKFSLLENPNMVNKIDYGPCNKIFKKEIFSGLEFSIKYKYEDLIPVFMALLKAKKITICNKLLYNYYINDTGETQTVNERNIDMYCILNELLNNCKKYKTNKDFWKELEHFSVYRIYENFGLLISTKYNYLLDKYIDNSIDMLKKNFGNFSSSINGNFLKQKLLSSKIFCKLFIKLKRREIHE